MGLGVAGLAVLGLSLFFLIFMRMFITDGGDFYTEMTIVLEALAGFSPCRFDCFVCSCWRWDLH